MDNNATEDSRLYPEFPISCVGVVVYNADKILLVKRAKEPGKGMWSIPGGAIELGETVHEAAAREVLEECSIEIKTENVLDSVENIIRDENERLRYHYVIIDLVARYAGGELKAGSDAAECGWFTTDEVATMNITPTLRAMLEHQGIIENVG